MARWLAAMAVFVASCACAADLSAGLDAYEKGDYRKALVEWRTLAREGDPDAQYRLARMYADGIGVPKDTRIAARWFLRAAEQGSVKARHELALAYSLGRGVRQDQGRAAHWYRRLAEDGYANSQYLLAGLYEEGKGVARNLSRAAYWYRRAAEQGLVQAQAKLGAMYSQGIGVVEDPVEAWAWLDVAAAKGSDAAARERTRLRARLSVEQLARAADFSRELRSLTFASATADKDEPDPAKGSKMVRIEAGCFAMGSDPGESGRGGNETRRIVCVDDFSLSRLEVTRGEYAEFVIDTGRDIPNSCQVHGNGGWAAREGRSWQEPGFAQMDDHPAVCVSRDDALAYAAWLSEHRGREYRLPTEAEWEYAARAGATTSRYWGDEASEACAWANVGDRDLNRSYPEWPWTIHPCDDGYVHTSPVGSFRMNRYGIHDILGNVWEWTCSAYEDVYNGAERRCAGDGRVGVVRGGSWSNSPRWARLAGRFESRADARFDLVGFRLAHD